LETNYTDIVGGNLVAGWQPQFEPVKGNDWSDIDIDPPLGQF
jgi:hypothetical protein